MTVNDDDLLIDGDHPRCRVNAVTSEAERFTLAQPGGGAQGPGLAHFSARKISLKFNVDGITSPAEVTSYHRPLEFYIGSFRDANLWITDLQEPHPTDEQLPEDPWWQRHFPRSLFLLLVVQKARRPAGTRY